MSNQYFVDIEGIVRKEFVPIGQTVNGKILLRSEVIEGKHPVQTSTQMAQQLLGPAS
jgi:hypothetical protein